MTYKNEVFDLSIAQQAILLNQMRYASSPLYNIGGYIQCTGIDVKKITEAHQMVVRQHDAFGIRIGNDNGKNWQYISAERDIELPIVDFSSADNPIETASTWLKTLFDDPVDYKECQLCRSWLVKLNGDRYWYVGIGHHLAVDGWGFFNWAKKLADIYNHAATDTPTDSIANIDGLSWQSITGKDQDYLNSKRCQADKTYWQNHCQSIDRLDLRVNYPQQVAKLKTQMSRRHVVDISRDSFTDIQAFADSVKVGVPQVFLAVLATYFCTAYNKSNVCFGIPVHNRRNKQEKDFVGVFSAMSPLVIEVNQQASFAELVKNIKKSQSSNYRHQRYPLSHMVQDSALSGVDNALYEVMFNYLKLDYQDLAFGGENARVIFGTNDHQQMPLNINIFDGDSSTIEMHLEYNQSYFSQAEIELLASRILALLALAGENSTLPLAKLNLLPDAERNLLVEQYNATQADFPDHACVHEVFEAQVEHAPQAIAVVFEEAQLSYGELNRRANQLAHYLIKTQQVTPDSLVGICLERSLDMVTAILAVLKAGGAYVPMDPDYPAARLAYMLEDAQLETVITDSSVLARTPIIDEQALCIDAAAYVDDLPTLPQHNPQAQSW